MAVDPEFLRLTRAVANGQTALERAFAQKPLNVSWIEKVMAALEKKRKELAEYKENHKNTSHEN